MYSQTLREILFSTLKIENHDAVDGTCEQIVNQLILPLEKKMSAQREEIKRLTFLASRSDEDRMVLAELT